MSGQSMMRQTIARKLGLDIAALTRDPASGQQLPGLVPTLFVGIGGSGAKVLGRIKKRLRLGQPEENSYASFLLIDTDPSALVGASPLLGPQEVVGCPLAAGPEGEDPAMMLPVRARGHQAYVAGYEAIDRGLALAFRRLPPPDWRGAAEGPRLHPERTAIVLVGSLWGVTGSGMVLDIAYHLGRIAPHAWKAAYLLLPGAYDPLAEQEDPSMAFANAYAALSEINYLATIDPATGTEGSLWVDGPSGEPMKYKGAPWERCYLVEGANVDNMAQLYDSNCAMLADALFWDMTFVLGAWKWALRDRLGYAAARTGGGPFASFGMAALRFPRERVVATCSRRFTEQLLTRWIGQTAAPAEATGPKVKPPRGEIDIFLEQHSEWKSSGLIKRLTKLKGKGTTSVDIAISDWARPLADEAEVKKHGRNVATVLLKEWQRMEVSHFSPKADADGWGPKIDANIVYRAEKYREALEEAVQDKLKYDAQGWQGLQGVMALLEELGKKVAGYGPKYEENFPKLKKTVAERKEQALAAHEELSKLCSNPITFPFSGAKVQAAAASFAASAQAHLQAHLEVRATATAGRLARKLVEECRAAFERLASARDVIAHARSMIKQQEDPEPVVGDVFRPDAIAELFAQAFPPEVPATAGAPTKKLNTEPSPFQLASKRISVELGCDSLPALLDRIRAGEVMAGTLAEIATEEGRRAFAPFASSIDFVDHYKRTFPAPEEQVLGLADTYFRAAPFVRFNQPSPAGVVIGVNGMAFTEDGYKAIGPLLQAVPIKETEVGLVPLQEGEDEGVVYYREVAGLHITSLPAVTEAQPCYDWIVSQGIAGLHISVQGPEAPQAPEAEAAATETEAAATEAEAAATETEQPAPVAAGSEPVAPRFEPASPDSSGQAEAPADSFAADRAKPLSGAPAEGDPEPSAEQIPGHRVEADPFEAIVSAALRENGTASEEAVHAAQAFGAQAAPEYLESVVPQEPETAPYIAPYIAPAMDTGAPYIASSGDTGAPYIASSVDTGAPYIEPSGDIGAPYIASSGDTGGPYIASSVGTGAPYIAPAMDTGAPYIAPAGDAAAPYIAPAGDAGAPYIAPAPFTEPTYTESTYTESTYTESPYIAPPPDGPPAHEQPANGPSRPVGGNAAAMQVGVDDTPFEINLDPAALADIEAGNDAPGFSFDPFK